MKREQYLTVEEVAHRFGVTASTIYRLAQQGRIPGFKVGGQWRFSEQILASWVVDQVTAERFRAEDQTRRRPGRARRSYGVRR